MIHSLPLPRHPLGPGGWGEAENNSFLIATVSVALMDAPRIVGHLYAITHLNSDIQPIPEHPELYAFDTVTRRWIMLPIVLRPPSPTSVMVHSIR